VGKPRRGARAGGPGGAGSPWGRGGGSPKHNRKKQTNKKKNRLGPPRPPGPRPHLVGMGGNHGGWPGQKKDRVGNHPLGARAHKKKSPGARGEGQ